MEVKDPRKDVKLLAGDLLPPEPDLEALKGPSRRRAIIHLTGIGLGFLLVVVGAGLGFSRNMWDRLALIPLISGGALAAGWVTINYSFLARMVRNRRVMVGTNAVFLGILAVVLLTMVNFISYRHYRKWDLTRAGLFTLSEKTQNVLKSLDRDVTIISFRLAQRRTGQEEAYGRFRELMRLYMLDSQHIKMENAEVDLDPEAAKALMKKFNIDANFGVQVDDLFVVCGEKKKVLRLAEMMEWEYFGNPYQPQRRPKAFKGEQYITSAIIEVTEDRQTKLYALTGHGERSVSDAEAPGLMTFAGALRRDNFVIETLASIPDAGVPLDCDCLLIIAPKAPLAEREILGVRRYLERGGRLLVCEEWDGRTGIEDLLAQYGAKVDDDLIITQDARTFLGTPASILLQDFGDHDITRPLANYSVAVDFARSITPSDMPDEKYKVTELIRTSDASYGETDLETISKTGNTTPDPERDRKGPLCVGLAIEEQKPQAESDEGEPSREKKLARIVVFGDADIFSNNILKLPMANLDLSRNTIGWLVERKELIAIADRPEIQHIMVADKAAKYAVGWLMVLGIPLAMLLSGGLVWAVRSYGSRAK